MRRHFYRVIGSVLALAGLAVVASAVGAASAVPEVTTPVQAGVLFVGVALFVLGATVLGRMGTRRPQRQPTHWR